MVTRIVQTTEFVTIQGNAIKLGVRGFVRICIETCATLDHQVLGTIKFLQGVLFVIERIKQDEI